MPARVERTERKEELQLIGEPTGKYYDVVMFFGIIDILQDCDITKKLEYAYKSIQYDPTSISAVDPRQYAKRFRDFILRVFSEVKSALATELPRCTDLFTRRILGATRG